MLSVLYSEFMEYQRDTCAMHRMEPKSKCTMRKWRMPNHEPINSTFLCHLQLNSTNGQPVREWLGQKSCCTWPHQKVGNVSNMVNGETANAESANVITCKKFRQLTGGNRESKMCWEIVEAANVITCGERSASYGRRTPELLSTYKAFIHSSMKSCSPLWAGYPASHLAMFDAMEAKAFNIMGISLNEAESLGQWLCLRWQVGGLSVLFA